MANLIRILGPALRLQSGRKYRAFTGRFGTVTSRVFRFHRTTDWRTHAMSNLNAIGLILAILIAGTFVTFYATKWIHIRSDAITTGIVRGISISTKERWMKLFHDWLPMAFGISLFDLILAVGFIEIAENLTDQGVILVAWLSGAAAGFSCVFWLILGISYFVNLVLILREAKNR
jgi:hypothetical protein